MKKKEIIFIAGILLLAILLWDGFQIYRNKTAGSIRITVNGEEFGIYSLSKDQTIRIGDTNLCEIKDGQARMIDATCPDHLCMQQGAVGRNGGLIVCLPNKVVIEGITADASYHESAGVDAVS